MIRKLFMPKHLKLINHLLCAVFLSYAPQLVAGSDIFVDFEATLGFDDNVTRAAEDIDIEHDGFLTVGGTGGYELYQGRTGTLVGKVLLEGNKFSRFDGLSNAVLAGKLNYTFGFSREFGAPWFALDVAYGITEFKSFQRDSNIASASATMGMQIDDATSMRLGLSFRDRDAESSVFDTQNASFFINMDWAVVKKHIVYVTYKYDQGDIFSSITDGTADLYVINASEPNIVNDDVFTGKKTYRLDGTTHFLTLGYNWIQSLHSSFDFSARYLESTADDVDLTYSGLTLRATFFHRFNL